MHRLVTRLGLVRAIDAALNPLKIHPPYPESDHVLALAYSLLLGGTRPQDVDRLRNDVPLMTCSGQAAAGSDHDREFLRRSPRPACSRWCTRVDPVRSRYRGAGPRAASARWPTSMWKARPCPPPAAQSAHGYLPQGIWDCAPLLVTLANTRKVLRVVDRPPQRGARMDTARVWSIRLELSEDPEPSAIRDHPNPGDTNLHTRP
jgi:hypothetical protein